MTSQIQMFKWLNDEGDEHRPLGGGYTLWESMKAAREEMVARAVRTARDSSSSWTPKCLSRRTAISRTSTESRPRPVLPKMGVSGAIVMVVRSLRPLERTSMSLDSVSVIFSPERDDDGT